MNERIDELAFEAGCHRHKYWDPKHPDLEGFIINQETLEKFAELIVQECLLAISKTDVTLEEMSVMVKCHTQVEKHFGIE